MCSSMPSGGQLSNYRAQCGHSYDARLRSSHHEYILGVPVLAREFRHLVFGIALSLLEIGQID